MLPLGMPTRERLRRTGTRGTTNDYFPLLLNASRHFLLLNRVRVDNHSKDG